MAFDRGPLSDCRLSISEIVPSEDEDSSGNVKFLFKAPGFQCAFEVRYDEAAGFDDAVRKALDELSRIADSIGVEARKMLLAKSP